MVRKQVYIEPRQERRLRTLVKELGVTEAELIRQGIDRGLDGFEDLRADPEARKAVERFILARMRKGPLKGRWGWTREGLYAR